MSLYLYMSNYADPKRGGGLIPGLFAVLVEEPCHSTSNYCLVHL